MACLFMALEKMTHLNGSNRVISINPNEIAAIRSGHFIWIA